MVDNRTRPEGEGSGPGTEKVTVDGPHGIRDTEINGAAQRPDGIHQIKVSRLPGLQVTQETTTVSPIQEN